MSLAVLPIQSCDAQKTLFESAQNLFDPTGPRLLPDLKNIDGDLLDTLIWGPLTMPIGTSPLLKKLHLKESGANQAMLAVIVRTFCHLKTVCLTREVVDKKNLSELACLKTLQKLKLTLCRISTHAVRQFSQFTHLNSLTLDSTSLDNRQLASLISLTQLTTLRADTCRINGVGINSIAKLTALKTLSLRDNQLDDEKVARLALLRNLTDLDLSENPDFQGEGLDAFRSLFKLKAVAFVRCNFIEGVAIQSMPQLTSLDLESPCSQMEHLTGLTHLSELSYRAELNGHDLRNLSKLRGLVYLDLSETLFKLSDPIQLKQLSSLTNLNALYLEGIHFDRKAKRAANPDESTALTEALSHLTQLGELSLTLGCFNQVIAGHLHQLTELYSFSLTLENSVIDAIRAKLFDELSHVELNFVNCEIRRGAKPYLEAFPVTISNY